MPGADDGAADDHGDERAGQGDHDELQRLAFPEQGADSFRGDEAYPDQEGQKCAFGRGHSHAGSDQESQN